MEREIKTGHGYLMAILLCLQRVLASQKKDASRMVRGVVAALAIMFATTLSTFADPEFYISGGVLTAVELNGATEVVIPDGVTSIEDSAFYGCRGLTNVTFMGNAPSVSTYAFSGVESSCVASVSPKSTGWGVEVGEKWNELTLQYWPEVLTATGSDAEVGEVIATFADKELSAQISTVR